MVEPDVIFILQRLWHDSSSNSYDGSRGYAVVGFVTAEEEARRICEEAGTSTQSGWPDTRGMPYMRYRRIERWTRGAPPPDPGWQHP